MKFKFILSSFIALFVFAFSSCEKDTTTTPTPSTTTYSDVSSILTSNCATTGCHNTTTAESSVNFSSFVDITGNGGTYTNTISLTDSRLIARAVTLKTMPVNSSGTALPLSQADRDLLQSWADNDFAQ